MLIGTHTLLPVCACLAIDHLSVAAGRGRVFPRVSLWVIGVFGALPDLCSPHLSLEARFTSWSHSIWFMAGLVIVAVMAGSFFRKGCRLIVALACWLAAALHLAADAVSGGIAWLYPQSDEVFGRYWISPQHWICFDAFFILLVWGFVRVLPHVEARRFRINCDEGRAMEDL